ncbi:MAG TPA: DNA polymerase III subunit epsilon [Cryomorphaceae bacterium]|nr:DNA polymerase III subunit epsilon [Cryomorphaceae bacterium]
MQLQLQRPICFFDLETTGVNVTNDRIVEICVHKVHPSGKEETHTWRVNPTIPIPTSASLVHGIYDHDVTNEPTFKELAVKVYELISNSDLAGYNSNKFDIPLLAEEFLRAGIDFEMGKRLAVDVQNIFHRMEQRTLSAAYKFYCDKSLENAHSAEADVLATYEVLKAQIDKYEDLQNNIKFLADFSNRQKVADFAGFIAYNDKGEEVFTFGKYRGKTVQSILNENPGYYSWIQNADFPLYTKKVLTAIKLRGFNNA